MRDILPAPPETVTGGKCNWGTFREAVGKINMLDAASPLGYACPRFWKKFRLKEWEALQLMHEEWFICLAVYNTKSIGTAVLMVYNLKEKKLYRYDKKVPAGRLVIASGLESSHTYYHGNGFSIDINNHLEKNRIDVSFHSDSATGLPAISAEISALHNTEPVVVVQPFGKNRPLYSHKALMRSEGKLNIEGYAENLFTPETSAVIVDDHKGYYPYRMRYDWCTACGYTQDGKLAGFNLTDNQIKDHEKFNENCIWISGKMYPLPPVSFSRPEGLMSCWQVRDNEGLVEIDFHPLADVPNVFNCGIIRLNYHGVFGQIKGSIDSPAGKIRFDDFSAMGEKKFIRM